MEKPVRREPQRTMAGGRAVRSDGVLRSALMAMAFVGLGGGASVANDCATAVPVEMNASQQALTPISVSAPMWFMFTIDVAHDSVEANACNASVSGGTISLDLYENCTDMLAMGEMICPTAQGNYNEGVFLENLAAGTYYIKTYMEGLAGTGAFRLSLTGIPTGYLLEYSAGANGTLSGDTLQEVEEGGHGTAVTAVPDDGYEFVGWSDDRTDNPRTDSNVVESISVSALFEATTHLLEYSAGEHGTLSGDTVQEVVDGEDGTAVTAVPDSGYEFVEWSDGVTDNPRTDSAVVEDIAVNAVFEPATAVSGDAAGARPAELHHALLDGRIELGAAAAGVIDVRIVDMLGRCLYRASDRRAAGMSTEGGLRGAGVRVLEITTRDGGSVERLLAE